ncbi:hypothetical protein ACWEQ7_26760 [Streptomyces sp. NPDC004069]
MAILAGKVLRRSSGCPDEDGGELECGLVGDGELVRSHGQAALPGPIRHIGVAAISRSDRPHVTTLIHALREQAKQQRRGVDAAMGSPRPNADRTGVS